MSFSIAKYEDQRVGRRMKFKIELAHVQFSHAVPFKFSSFRLPFPVVLAFCETIDEFSIDGMMNKTIISIK